MKIRTILLVLMATVCAGLAGAQASGPDLVLTKTGPANASADSDIVYTVTVTNVGDVGAPSPVVTDGTPAGTSYVSASTDTAMFTCTPNPPTDDYVQCTTSGGTLDPGATATFTFTFHVDPDVPDGTLISNSANVTSATWYTDPETGPYPSDANEENNYDFAVTAIGAPVTYADVSVTKSGPQFAPPAGLIEYVITVVNAGPDAAETVEINDTLPGDLTFVSLVRGADAAQSFSCATPAFGAGGTITCTTASLPQGSTATFTLTAEVPSNAQPGTEYANVVSVSASNDVNNENDVSSATTFISQIDMAVVKSGTASVDAGQTITYTIDFTNNGPDNALFAELSDTLPAGTTFVSLTRNSGPVPTACITPEPGSTGTIVCRWDVFNGTTQFTLVVATNAAGPVVTNTASATAEGFDVNLANNSDDASTTVNQISDLSVTKTGPASVQAGTSITWTVTVTNAGPSVATSVAMYDTLPSDVVLTNINQTSGPVFSCTRPPVGSNGGLISCTVPSLPPGSATFQIQAAVSTTAVGPLTNNVSVTSATSDPDSDDRDASAASAVTPAPEPPPEPIPSASTIALAVLAVALALSALFMRGPS